MHDESTQLAVGINDKMPLGQTIIYALQHLFALTGIWAFPVIIGHVLHLKSEQTALMVQACFFTTGLVTILQSGRLLRLPVVQGPTAAFMVAVMGSANSVGLATTFGSMTVAALIFALLALPVKKFGLMGLLIRYISPPIVFGSLLVIIGAQLAAIGPGSWFDASASGSVGISALVAAITMLTVMGCLIFARRDLIKRGALLWGIIVGTIAFSLLAGWHLPNFSHTSMLALPDIYPFGFGVSWPIVLLMMMAFLQASAEAMGMYSLLTRWGKQKLTPERVNRGLFTEFIGCAIGSVAGGLGTTSYPENVGIIRVSGIASRFVTMTAGIFALILGLIPKVGLLVASIPTPVLSAASSILFGIIAISGIQMLAKVNWDERNIAVAAPAFIISLGSMYLPASVTALLPPSLKDILAQPMMIGVILLIVLNTLVNFIIRKPEADAALQPEQEV
ncbi:uracil-xanthine permease family protein [Celerinatantimonas sp. MCCC 1A17872]|uniref:uracil-xanthine permease family protein n=1 Tax=Celerinatantimonas sp. MCCC 1A17872 TaxID=3177514 RepID=UPI0038C6B405